MNIKTIVEGIFQMEDELDLECTPPVRQLQLGQPDRIWFGETVLQTPQAADIRERNAAACDYKLLR